MQTAAKRELATAIRKTQHLREASYRNGHYDLSWAAAAEKGCGDPDLVDLVHAICVAGYYEFSMWCEDQLGEVALIDG